MPDLSYPGYGGSEPPTHIMGTGELSADLLAAFFMDNNASADEERVLLLAELYIEECAVEGVNSDVAFAQMCLETGFLRFGGLVTEDMNNFCGLGATDPAHPGLCFPDERTGIRAHVQHLKAYGSTEPLAGEQVDPRFGFVSPRGRSPTVMSLAGTWAADRQYGEKLAEMLDRMFLYCRLE
ncbi:glucosaminidase domain-containing protein [Candidatus Fermentibacteria bacterium]|nr:glucosaminidase domain-containing protein [Candidatus Fermentibacteria bacterium]